MPCYDPGPTKEELVIFEKEDNDKKYGIYKTDSELIAHLLNMCCQMGDVIFQSQLEHRLSPDTIQWYERHKIRDEKIARVKEQLAVLQYKENLMNSDLQKLKEAKVELEKQIKELNN